MDCFAKGNVAINSAASFPVPLPSADTANQNINLSPVDILLVEDSTIDARLTQRALDHLGIHYHLNILNKGNRVLPYLHNSQNKKPDVILLDLGLPDMSGFDILEMMADESIVLRSIPFIVLTGFESFAYIRKIHWLTIADFISKPCRTQDLCQATHNALLF